ncbi:MAG TPA: HlyD family secretion protein [Bradyrhizobium sp.]|jgi:membrane fusion protein (multidrug efflux system)|nr:HlyD family secretion protein [Bradyrhizobium sp.]
MNKHVSTVDEASDHFFKRTSNAKETTAGHRRLRLGSVLASAAAIALLVAAGFYGDYYWMTGRFLVSTDDAYVQAHSVLISPKVSGYISEVPVDDNQPVKAGEALARIDPRDYQTALDQARANVAVAQASINTFSQQIAQQKLVIEQDRQQVASDQAALVFSQQDFQRYTHLATTGYGTVQRAQQAQADISEKQAALQHDSAIVAAAEKQVSVFEGQLAQANATLTLQQAMEHQAELNLSYTRITAPVDGTVGVRTLRVGEYVQAGTQLMAIAPLQAVFIVANYKETQLTDVHPGQGVAIHIDTFPGTSVHGHVDSLAPASGQEFALLPPDNATGNFTKVVQRIPVKIEIDKNEPLLGRLRPGMSVEPTIDTRPISAAPTSGRVS